MDWTYEQKPETKLNDWYKAKARDESIDLNDFPDFESFKGWYYNHKMECFYCGLTEEESQQIFHDEILTSKRPRGRWLEIDRKDPKPPNDIYSKENCVLSCYFCNNDKSDIFTSEQYMVFMKDRADFLKRLLKKS